VLAPATRRPVLVHSTSPPPAAPRARVAGGAEEPLLARHIRSSKRRRQDAYATSRRRRTHTRSRRLSLRLRERLCSPSRTPRCRSSSRGEARPGELSVVCSRPPFMPSTQLVDHRAAAIIRSTRLLQPWHCASAARAGARAEAIALSPGRWRPFGAVNARRLRFPVTLSVYAAVTSSGTFFSGSW
jgi:hypothetical protein